MASKKGRKNHSTARETKRKQWDVPVESGFTYEVDIHGYGSSGEGVGRVEDFTVFVPYAMPGERVKAQMTLVKKQYAKAQLQEVMTPSEDRTEPSCDVYGQCGGCRLQHVSYEGQKAMKQQKVKDCISRLAKDDATKVLPTMGMENPWAYRNKMQMPVGGTKGQIEMGFYASESHDIVSCMDCGIQKEENNIVAKACYEIATAYGVAPYDEKTGEGVLRHVISRVTNDGEIMIILVTATKTLPHADRWVEALQEKVPHLVSIVQNYNPAKTNVIMGRDNTFLWGTKQIKDSIGNLTFSLSPHSFFQVNPEQTEALYNTALAYANLTGEETVIDAYCGTGTISLFLAQKAKRVIGIEIVEPAVEDARKNAQANGITNAEFIAGDAAQIMPHLEKDHVDPDVIVFDPIRAGCKPAVLEAALAMKPKRMVYVSCNPASMARDIVILREGGYELQKVQPVDMFPMTAHVECVALLEPKDN